MDYFSPRATPVIKFDQVVKGNVTISKIGFQKYKIIFQKVMDFTLYQVWDNKSNNNQRLIINDNSKKWQERLINEQKKNGFTPTTIMEIGNCKYAFVITNAYFIKNKLVFEVSTKEIINLSNTVQKNIKCGFFKNVRFDIDNISDSSFNSFFQFKSACLSYATYIKETFNRNIICLPSGTGWVSRLSPF